MKKVLIALFILLLIPIPVVFSLPYKNPEIPSPFIGRMALILTIDQGTLFIASGLLTFQSMFRSNALGGIVGVGLRIFSVGLIGLGLGFIQFPIMLYLNAWNSPYFTSGLYYVAYAVGGLGMVIGLAATALKFKSHAGATVGIALVIGAVFRIIGILYPTWIGALPTLTYDQIQRMHTVNAILLAIMCIITAFSFFLQKTFGSSVIGSIFRQLVVGFILLFIVVLFTLQENIAGDNHWYFTSGFYFFLVFLSAVIFARFSFNIRYLKY